MAERTEWVICWFLDGLGQGWISDLATGVVPWTDQLGTACKYATKEEAERQIIQWHLQTGFDTENVWVEMVDKK